MRIVNLFLVSILLMFVAGGILKSEDYPAASEEVKPMSIFNEEVKLFKFRIEHADVTEEEAAAFTVRYKVKGNPDILGAYPDPKTNSLCVIGPPEAEHAIRKSLAMWIIETQGIPGPALLLERRDLQSERKGLLVSMAYLELALVDAAQKVDPKEQTDAKAIIQSRLDATHLEVEVLDKKLQIVDRYLKRMQDVAK